MPADHFHDAAIRQLREAPPAVFLRSRHAEHAEPAQTGDDLSRDLRVAIDGRRVDVFLAEAAHLGDLLVGPVLLLGTQAADRG